jgi:hypothetical protein
MSVEEEVDDLNKAMRISPRKIGSARKSAREQARREVNSEVSKNYRKNNINEGLFNKKTLILKAWFINLKFQHI